MIRYEFGVGILQSSYYTPIKNLVNFTRLLFGAGSEIRTRVRLSSLAWQASA